MLNGGADPYAIDNSGLLPIHRAVLLSFGDVVELLLSAMEARLDGDWDHTSPPHPQPPLFDKFKLDV